MRHLSFILAVLFASSCVCAAAADVVPENVSFNNDVMAVISKAGCNMGACHGNKSGKGGFKLSLRSEDPIYDYNALTRDVFARRIDPLDPDRSLILLKATGAIAHEGGKRFAAGDIEYQILRKWIDAGASRSGKAEPKLVKLDVTPTSRVLIDPEQTVQIKAIAHYSDGSQRDVSRLACYEQSQQVAELGIDGTITRKPQSGGTLGETTVIVRYLHLQQAVALAFVPARPTFAWSGPPTNNVIDEQVFAKLQTLRTNPSELAGDDVFIRRAYLDLLGMLPTADEVKAFVADGSADKRTKLIETLLKRPEYADFWALKWADALRVEERSLDTTGVKAFHGWIRQAVADNMPLDQFVRNLVTSTGSTYQNAPANYYRALRNPVARGEAAAQVFLGTRLNCAQCHNHPFDRWTQDDYYGWADVFSRLDYKIIENKRRDKNDMHEFIGEQIVLVTETGSVNDPRTDKPVNSPRLLGAAQPLAVKQDRLQSLGDWLTRDNRLFAKAQVNRIWAHLMGRGLVDPVDDFRATNPASHPALLEQLADEFVASGYDVKTMIRLITASRTYQLSSDTNETNADDEVNYSHVVPRRMTAEQMADALHQVAGVASQFSGYDKGTRAAQIAGVPKQRRGGEAATTADQFLISFGRPPRELACDCERSNETALNHTFQLVSGPLVADLISRQGNRIDQMIAAKKPVEQMVDELYMTALGRPATTDERTGMAEHVKRSKEQRKGLEDVMWALVNAKEFVLRK
ncbi:DUF1549 and DUF1553 domain-containing protein [Humisphaera borealis]|uniref:DUF1553 domain-containing protein n=1 Tax=Humisphaera borealis TaxID=2807512 RepID=A0A7M2WWA5_9BACT|nr:DUF1549 and DUF1553 domain-containing protein [Humisphaera borealis]QOV89827.1 DUF1553 domain-containing protein [Humisphaera borealis]